MKKIKITIILIISVVVFLIIALNSLALSYKAPTRIVNIGVLEDFNLLTQNKDGTYSGYLTEYLQEIAAYTLKQYNVNLEFKYTFGTHEKLFFLLKNNKADIITASDNKGDNNNFKSENFKLIQSVLITLKNNQNLCFEDYKGYKDLTVGYISNQEKSILQEYAKQHKISWNLKNCVSLERMKKLMSKNKIDAYISCITECSKQDKILDYLATSGLCFQISEENESIIEYIKFATNEIKTTKPNYISYLENKYSENNGTYTEAYTRKEQDYLNSNPIINIACKNNHNLIKKDKKTGAYFGSYASLCEMISDICGFDYKISVEQSIDEALNNKNDILLGIYQSNDVIEDRDIVFSKPFLQGILEFWGKDGHTVDFLNENNVALVCASESFKDYINEKFPKWIVIDYPTVNDGIQSILNNTSDILVIDSIIDEPYLIINNKLKRIYDVNTPQINLVLGLNKNSPNFEELLGITDKMILSTPPEEFLSRIFNNKIKKTTIKDFVRDNIFVFLIMIFLMLLSVTAIILFHFHKIYKAAYYDKELSIKNRNYLKSFGHKYFNANKKLSVAIVDIAKMQQINTLLGIDMGDNIARFVASHLDSHSSSELMVIRDFSLNFIILMPYSTEDSIKEQLKNMLQPISLYSKERIKTKLEYHTGVYINCSDDDLMTCIRKAEDALFSAKNKQTDIDFYDIKIEYQTKKEKHIEDKMEEALLNNEFKVFLQPKCNSKTGTTVGAEALVRWISDDGTVIYPSDFIPLFECNGFIIQLDNYMFEQVCIIQSNLIAQGIKPVPISVNQSRLNTETDTYVQNLKEIADRYSVPYNLLEIEVTEYIYGNSMALSNAISQLKKIGFIVSIDDFGSGYSSLNMLKYKAVDFIKLDKEFLKDKVLSNETKAIINGIIRLADALHIKTICEGVETKEQAEFLKEINCTNLQGYYFSRPIEANVFIKRTYNI